MPFVKLDTGILDSSLWVDKDARDVFLTSLLMAAPIELDEDTEQIEVRSFKKTGWIIPAGWYGMVSAAAPGIIARSGVPIDDGMRALERCCSPDPDSRTPDHEGRRMARIPGGYVILNFDLYRQKDYTSADRSARYRERKAEREGVQPPSKRKVIKPAASTVDFDIFWQEYPRKKAKPMAWKAWQKICPDEALLEKILSALADQKKCDQWVKDGGRFIPHPSTWLNQRRWEDQPEGEIKPTRTTEAVASSWKKPLPVVASTMPKDGELF